MHSQIIGNLLAFVSVNKFGRRFLFNWGMVGCAVVNFLIAFLAIPGHTNTNWAMAIFVCLLIALLKRGVLTLCYRP
jgi:MFS transporter, SP family, general alpha glucoside:H+ symporter